MLNDKEYKKLLIESYIIPNPRDRDNINPNRCPICMNRSINPNKDNKQCSNDHTWHINNGAISIGSGPME